MLREQLCLFTSEEMNSLLDFNKGKNRLYKVHSSDFPYSLYYKTIDFDESEDMNIIQNYWNKKDFGKN